MSEWAAKRFWTTTATVEVEEGYGIALDGREVKTPAKSALVLPTAEMAAAVAEEWDAQDGQIDPSTMPVTRGANSAIDKVMAQRAEVVQLLAAYGDSDLLCYRAAGPTQLIAQQADAWDPLLDWAAETFGVRLRTGEGVMHVEQDLDGQARLTAELDELTAFELAGAHDLISLSGSLIIALAVIKKHISTTEGWAASRVDEAWQISQWGEDDEAMIQEKIKNNAFQDAARFIELCKK
ncbi:MAG: ATP12 family protein [Pseudomonadota bacterium]